jgi:hypothetical protein
LKWGWCGPVQQCVRGHPVEAQSPPIHYEHTELPQHYGLSQARLRKISPWFRYILVITKRSKFSSQAHEDGPTLAPPAIIIVAKLH